MKICFQFSWVYTPRSGIAVFNILRTSISFLLLIFILLCCDVRRKGCEVFCSVLWVFRKNCPQTFDLFSFSYICTLFIKIMGAYN